MVRYTPKEIGTYRYEALHDHQVIDTGAFECIPSDHPGYVRVSEYDPRYFAFTNGDPFCAIGLNLCSPPMYPLPRGMEHFAVGDLKATLGLREYRRWFRLLSENGGNFTRIWLSNAYLQTETEQAGQVDAVVFNRLDGIIELAREYGIRLKLCFDHFRAFQSGNPVTPAFFLRRLADPVTGREATSMDEWLTDPVWQERWFQKVQAYLDRYSGDPVVMAWELWNEMDCVEASRWQIVRDWTQRMLQRIKQAAPDHLVVNSLGSFDDERKKDIYGDLAEMPEMDFHQVHRYLDQGASWGICTEDAVGLSVDAIRQTCIPDRPILLAETGAVNDRHTGEFRYYRLDHQGIIFHDTTFPAFFAGAAGTGQHWFWDRYVDQKDLWDQFRPFVEMLDGIALDREDFQPIDLSSPDAWCLALKGKHTTLVWVRNRADSWQAVLRDGLDPAPASIEINLGAFIQVQSFCSWQDEELSGIYCEGGTIRIEKIRHGLMLRIQTGIEWS